MYQTDSERKKDLGQRLLVITILISTLLITGTLVYHLTEGWTYLDSLYFSAISLTQRGYSNLHPTNWFSVLFSVFYLLIGVGVVIFAVSNLIAYYASYYQDKVNRLVNNINVKKPERWLLLKPKKGLFRGFR